MYLIALNTIERFSLTYLVQQMLLMTILCVSLYKCNETIWDLNSNKIKHISKLQINFEAKKLFLICIKI